MTTGQTDVLLTLGKYAAAVAAITAAVTLTIKLFVTPMIIEERTARQKVDDRIVMFLLMSARDRPDFLDLMRTPVGPDFDRKMTTLREKWKSEEDQLLRDRDHQP